MFFINLGVNDSLAVKGKMEKLSGFIVKYRKIILILTLVAAVLSAVGLWFFMIGGRINSDMLEYLPEDTSTGHGIRFLKENFGVKGDAFVVAEGLENDTELEARVKELKKIEGVTQFIWAGDVDALDTLAENPYIAMTNAEIDTAELKAYLKRPIVGTDKYNYVFLILFDYSPSTQEAFNIHKQVREILNDRSVAISGMTALADTVMTETLGEAPFYFIFGGLAVLIVLLIASYSFFEPVILLITLLTAVLINLGTNLVYPSVSIISFAASGILQLGITMDYAIFFMYSYREKRQSLNPKEAASKAIPAVLPTVITAGLTTIGGFAALYFMKFQIGADIAKVVIKGIALSVLSVIILQPCLSIACDRLIQKTSHKPISLNFEKVTALTVRKRRILIPVLLVLIIGAFILQGMTQFSYLKIYHPKENPTPQEALAEKLGNQLIMAVPLHTKTGGHKEYINELLLDDKIDSVIGAYSAIDMTEESLESLLNLIPPSSYKSGPLSALGTLFRKSDGEWYTLYLLGINGDTEDENAFRASKHISEVSEKYFDNFYPLGILTGVTDMAEVTPLDFLKVSLFSALIILILLSINLKSFRKALVMVILIEFAIWLNISLNFIFGQKINFMVYILISSVQLGCTVDYGILLSHRFESDKILCNNSIEGAIKASAKSLPGVALSASMIVSTCLAIVFVSDNLLVREMAWVLARGAVLSFLVVSLFLPPILAYFNGISRKFSFRGK